MDGCVISGGVNDRQTHKKKLHLEGCHAPIVLSQFGNSMSEMRASGVRSTISLSPFRIIPLHFV